VIFSTPAHALAGRGGGDFETLTSPNQRRGGKAAIGAKAIAGRILYFIF
jgi:hypothetical protein